MALERSPLGVAEHFQSQPFPNIDDIQAVVEEDGETADPATHDAPLGFAFWRRPGNSDQVGDYTYNTAAEGADNALLQLVIRSRYGNAPNAAQRVRLICPPSTTVAVNGGIGTAVSGDGTGDAVFDTTAAGLLQVQFTSALAAVDRANVTTLLAGDPAPGGVFSRLQVQDIRLTHA